MVPKETAPPQTPTTIGSPLLPTDYWFRDHEPLRSDDLLTQHTELRKVLYLAITDLSRGIWRNSQRKSAIEQCGRLPSNGSSVPWDESALPSWHIGVLKPNPVGFLCTTQADQPAHKLVWPVCRCVDCVVEFALTTCCVWPPLLLAAPRALL